MIFLSYSYFYFLPLCYNFNCCSIVSEKSRDGRFQVRKLEYFISIKKNKKVYRHLHIIAPLTGYLLIDRGFSFERNCVLHWWESETLKVNYQPQS